MQSVVLVDTYLNIQPQGDIFDCVVVLRSLDEDFGDSRRLELEAVLQK